MLKTEHEIIEMAKTSLLAEMEASQMYTMAIGRTDNAEVKRTLQRLVVFEEHHVARLVRLFNDVFRDTATKFDPAEFVRTGKNTAIGRLSKKLKEAGLDKGADVRAVLKFAISRERAAQQWYASAMKRLDNVLLQTVFETLREEEKEHERMLRRLLRAAW